MKKLLITLLLLVVIATVATYIFVPNTNSVAEKTSIAANHKAVFRVLSEPKILAKLIQNKATTTSPGLSIFEYNGVHMRFQERLNDIIEVTIDQKGNYTKSIIQVISKGKDSTLVEWRLPLTLSYNPLKRIQQYIEVRVVKAKMTSFLNNLKTFAVQSKNIYGFDIKRAKLSDSLLITTKTTSLTPPSPEAYYSLIKQLQAYAESKDALVTNYPMLNITAINNTKYETMVALPINKEVPSNGAIRFKRMVPGNILITDIRGGLLAVNQGLEQLSNYMSDYDLIAPAIPFQSLISDRLANNDSSQWVTKLYYPIY